jgi:hypothetical protein
VVLSLVLDELVTFSFFFFFVILIFFCVFFFFFLVGLGSLQNFVSQIVPSCIVE